MIDVSTPAGRSAKAEQTRRAIVEAALTLFREQGYDQTTMRAVATKAGVSVGNAYYYFASKEHLVQGFYDRVQAEHAEATATVLADRRGFAPRLGGLLTAWLDIAEPYHAFGAQFFKNAADPASPLSPFSPESGPAREAALDLYRDLVATSDLKVTAEVRRELPELLWLLQMGLVLHWVYDDSADQQRTRALVDAVVPLVDKVVRLSRAPLVRGVVQDVLAVVATVKPGGTAT